MGIGREKCEICGRMISWRGCAKAAHMRAHVRRGEATEGVTGITLCTSRLVWTAVDKKGGE